MRFGLALRWSATWVGAFGAVVVAAPAAAQAQNATITGRVATNQGVPLPGANVFITELQISVGTNSAGNFTINIPALRVSNQAVTLRARSIGYKPGVQPLTIRAGSQTINFSLEQDVNRLTEVVVTGVSAATEAAKVPFAIAKVDTAQMPVVGSSPISQLQGKIPGANIVSASGRPGSAPSVLLRGPVSINAQGRSQQPLYIVDGVQLSGSIPDINPNDIASVEVLKGAAAANLYGARAGAGVINITTKSGKTSQEGIKFGFRTEAGAGDIPNEFDIAKQTTVVTDPTGGWFCSNAVSGGSPCAQYVDLYQESRRVNDIPNPDALPPTRLYRDYGIAGAPNFQAATGVFQTNKYQKTYDVIGQAITPSAFVNSNFDVRGRVGSTGVYSSLSNLTQQGAIYSLGGFNRNSIRLNLDQSFGTQVTASINSYYSTNKTSGDNQDAGAGALGFAGTNAGNAGGNGFFRLTRQPAYIDLKRRDALGRLYIRSNVLNQGEQNQNPLYDFENYQQDTRSGRFIGGATLRYTPLTWLDLESNFSFDRRTTDYSLLRDRGFRVTVSDVATTNGQIFVGAVNDQSLNTSVSATARRQLGDLLATFSTKYQYEQQDTRDQDQFGTNIVVPGLRSADAAIDAGTKDIGSTTQQIKGINFFGTMQLDYKDRYLIQANLRRDGSSLFGSGNRWATFPGISGSWIASREGWWPLKDALSLAKVRAAYGRTGQRPAFASQYATYTIRQGGVLEPATLGNPLLEPEIRSESEIGIDLEFFRRVGLNATYAVNVIDKQILPVPQSFSSGFISQWQNAGELTNRTLEFSLDVPILNRRDLNWSGRLIYDKTTSRVTRLDVAPFTTGTTLQATEAIFDIKNGEFLGTLKGTGFVTKCSQLPSAFQSDCGSANSTWRKNNDGYIVYVGQGNQLSEGISKNLWTTQLLGAAAPWGNFAGNEGLATRWGMPIVVRDSLGQVARVELGHVLPNYRMGFSQNFRYKKFSAYGLLDAAVGGKIWNQGYHWSLGDLMTGSLDQAGKSVEEAKPLGYYWRRGAGGLGGSSGVGGFYDVLGPNTETVESATYAKIREATVSYRVGAVGGVGDWSVGLVGRNLATFTGYRGFDPEVGIPGGTLNNAALNGVDRYNFPNLRTFTFQLSSAF